MTIKVTFENGHIINYKGRTDDSELWRQIAFYQSTQEGHYFHNTGYDSSLEFKIEKVEDNEMTNDEKRYAEFLANALGTVQNVCDIILEKDPSIDKQQAWAFATKLVLKSLNESMEVAIND